jgi:hypothetical protein
VIVVDENLHDKRILAAIAAWFPGRVLSVTALRPGTVIKDDAIPLLLRQAAQPTFVTINVSDFWKRVDPDHGYCIINILFPKERIREIPELLHRLFRLPGFKTKASRVGKVIRLTPQRIEYYQSDRQIRSFPWPD